MTQADIERLERAIRTTARVMKDYNLRQLLPTLKRLEQARDNLLADGDALEYAERVLSNLNRNTAPIPTLGPDASG